MSRGFKLATTATKGKGVSELTYEQVSDADNYGKRSVKPLPLVVDGLSDGQREISREPISLVLKPKTKIPSMIGPLDNVDDYTEIPKPVPLVQTAPKLKLKSYNGISH